MNLQGLKTNPKIKKLIKIADKVFRPWEATVNFVFFIFKCVFGAVAYILWRLWKPIGKNVGQVKPFVMPPLEWLHGKKTYLVSGVSIVGLFLAYFEGTVSTDALAAAPVMIAIMTVRHGLARLGVKPTEIAKTFGYSKPKQS